ncbi:MAG: PKD domain-containing protein [Thermoplasmatota archaeon]
MRGPSSLSRIGALMAVVLLAAPTLAVIAPDEERSRSPGLDVSATGFLNLKDINDPAFQRPYPVGQTTVTATVKNTGDVATSGFEVTLEVGYNSTSKRIFYADAEGASMPPGWEVRDLTTSRWRATNRTSYSGTTSAACIGEGGAAVQYGANWEEAMESASPISVPTGTPALNFRHNYATATSQDGGYIEIQNGSGPWERQGTGNWTFNTPGYNDVTAPINPISQNVDCFGGNSNGWLFESVNISKYAGYSIKVRFIFSSSGNFISPSGLSGWYIDDVVVTNGVQTTLQEDYESGMAKWKVYNLRTVGKPGGGVGTAWGLYTDSSPSYNVSSTKCFSNRNQTTNHYADGEDSVLVSPQIQLTGYTHARLQFQSKMQSQDATDGGFVEVQSSAGEWVHLRPFMTSYGSSLSATSTYGNIEGYSGSNPGGNWNRVLFDLTPFAGGPVRIRFHFFADEDDTTNTGWHIDEVTVVAWNLVNQAQDRKSVNPLDVGASSTVTSIFDLAQPGYYGLRATTGLAGDTVPGNNMAYILIQVENDFSFRMDFNRTSLNVIHGRKGEIGITLMSTGNTLNEIDLSVHGQPAQWKVNLSKPNPIFLLAGNQVSVRLDIEVPIDERSETHSFRVNATSRKNALETQEQEILVQVVNNPPTAVPGPNRTARVFAPLTFDGSASTDPEGDALFYFWDFGDGESATGVRVSHTYTSAGAFNVTLNVSDGGPDSWSAVSVEVVVSDDAPIAIVSIDTLPSNGTYQRGEPVVFNGTRSLDEKPELLQYDWNFGDGTEHGAEAVVEHTFAEGGRYDVVLTVTDAGGHDGVSDPYTVVINNPPTAVISSPRDRSFFLTTDDIEFSANGSSDPDGDELTYEWSSNLVQGLLGASARFTTRINVTGTHIIQLKVYDGKGRISYGLAMVTIDVSERTNDAPELRNGTVDPAEGDEEVTIFRYTVTYSDANNDMPAYVNLILDGRATSPQAMTAVDPLDINCTDGKDYEFVASVPGLLRGDIYPHNYSFETADNHGSGRVATPVYDGPVVKYLRDLRQDSWMPNVVTGWVYQTGGYRTPLNGVNVTPPPIPEGKLALDISFVMNTTAPPEHWYWANLTIRYSSLNFSKINESTMKVYWSVDGAPWTPVPVSGMDRESRVLWLNVTRANVHFAVFGDPVPAPPPPPREEGGAGSSLLYIGAAVAVVAIAAVGGVVIIRRRRPAAPPEPMYEEAPAPVAERPARKAVGGERPSEPDRIEATEGEVKIFRPAAAQEVKVFKPVEGEEVKVFRPGGEGGEESVKVFRPGGEAEEEAEEAPRPKVVEYKEPHVEEGDGGERGEAGSAEEEGAEPESQKAAAPEQRDGTGGEKGRGEKADEEELDRLLDELK